MTNLTSELLVNIERPWGGPNSVQVYPSDAVSRFELNKSTKTVSLWVSKGYLETKNILVTFDGDTFHSVVISLQPEKPIVIPTDPAVKYYASGVQYTSGNSNSQWSFPISEQHKTVFFENGAFVKGSLNLVKHASTGSGLTIEGPGVLLGEDVSWEYVASLDYLKSLPYGMIHSLKVQDSGPEIVQMGNTPVTVKEVTILRQPMWGINLTTDSSTPINIDSTVLVSPWTYNTTGLFVQGKVVNKNNFLFLNDDIMDAEDSFYGDMVTENNLLVGRSPYLMGYGYYPQHSHSFKGSVGIPDKIVTTVIPSSDGLFRSEMCGETSSIFIGNQQFGPLKIEGDVDRLFALTHRLTPWCSNKRPRGLISNISFSDISVTGGQRNKSQLIGWSDDVDPYFQNGNITNIRFKNISICGVALTSNNWRNYFEVSGPVKDIYIDDVNVCKDWGCP